MLFQTDYHSPRKKKCPSISPKIEHHDAVLQIPVYAIYKVGLLLLEATYKHIQIPLFYIPTSQYILKTTTFFIRKRILPFLTNRVPRCTTVVKFRTPVQDTPSHIKKPRLKILSFCPSLCSFLAVNCQAHYHVLMSRFKGLYNNQNNAPLTHQGVPKAQSVFT